MIDHMNFSVRDIEKSKIFYAATLGALGYVLCKDDHNSVSFGVREGHGKSTDPGGEFWIYKSSPMTPRPHVAFSAASRADVDAFHAAGIAAGGVDNGPPRLRVQYHALYYAAFVFDPDGCNIEAVCHAS